MRKFYLIIATISFALFLSIPVESKEPKYKALFNLGSDTRYYQYVDYKSSYKSEKMVLINIIDKRPEQEKTYDEDVQYLKDRKSVV